MAHGDSQVFTYVVLIYIYIYIYILTLVYINECIWANNYVCLYISHWLVGRMFTNGSGKQGLIPSWVIPNTQKKVLDTSLLNTQHYKVKWSNPGKGVAPFPIPWCRSYWKESLRVTNSTYLYIYIYTHTHTDTCKNQCVLINQLTDNITNR